MSNEVVKAASFPVPAKTFDTVAQKLGETILDFIGKIPFTNKRKASQPSVEARTLIRAAASKAALTSGSLALPIGPLGMLTLIPDLIAVWKIQAQLVADIAALYGKDAALTREQMIYCLFRHLAAQALRDVIVRAGERVLIRSASLGVLQTTANRIGVHVAQKVIGKSISRWIPIAGALGVGAYAYFDTHQVAATAIELFEQDVDVGQMSTEGR
ncbi:MAG: hypothetical protein JWN94_1842 [Betaproteobacteria bacterium]|nr:hypothetical protein [Betaproteobacteria bacterium]